MKRFCIVAGLFLFGCGEAPPQPSPSTWTEPVTGMEFVLLPAGSFRMGAPEGEIGREPGETLHEVTLSRPFYLGRYEVTQEEWSRVMGTHPSHFRDCGPRCPVENVNYHDIQDFLVRLEALAPGRRFRLPTEAEWEYACRAGTTSPYAGGENLTTDRANYDGDYPYADAPSGIDRQRPTPVGSCPANAWGLHDMHGNVWEWCEDWFCPYPDGPATDPLGVCAGEFKVIRGGSWYFNAESARSALRYTHDPVDLGPSLGFRVVREMPRRENR